MTTAFSLAKKVVDREIPPKVLVFGFLNTLSRWFKIGGRRFEFERLYGEHSDPWNYRTDQYEHAKYKKTLELILQHRRGEAAALEIGCSIGQFSGLLAEHFGHVTSVDFSREALASARDYNGAHANLEFVHQAIEALSVGRRYDVIVCAEMLYYIDKKQVENVTARLRNHLSPGGILVVVSPIEGREPDCWEALLAQRFATVADPVENDPTRPYQVCIFSEKAA